MISMTINDLMNVVPVLREMAEKPFKGAITFKLARLMREIDKEMTLFEESRQKLAEKYALRDDNGQIVLTEDGNIRLQEDKVQECNEEMISLLTTEVEINADKISASAFDEIEIAPNQEIAIDILIEY